MGNGPAMVYDMPLDNEGEVSPYKIAELCSGWSVPLIAVVENVSAMTYVDKDGHKRGQGAAASFNFGKSFGVVLGVLGARNIPTLRVPPSVWKLQMNLSSDKELSLKKAREIFPYLADSLKRKKDNDRAEALLLAWFFKQRA